MYLWLSEYIPNIPHFIINRSLWDFPADVDKMNSLAFWFYQTELLFWDGVYCNKTHTHPHTPYKNKCLNYMNYGELWTVLTTFSSLGDFRHLLLRDPCRKMFHFNNWHYDLQFKREKNKLRRVQTLIKAFGLTVWTLIHLINAQLCEKNNIKSHKISDLFKIWNLEIFGLPEKKKIMFFLVKYINKYLVEDLNFESVHTLTLKNVSDFMEVPTFSRSQHKA